MADDFIGERFGKEGQIEVIERVESTVKGLKQYNVKCHDCSKDPELFGNGIFKAAKSKLGRGIIPCGCTTGRPLQVWQYSIRAARRCDTLGYKFKGIVGDWYGSGTKLSIFCPKHGTVNNSVSYTSLIHTDIIPCDECRWESRHNKTATPETSVLQSF